MHDNAYTDFCQNCVLRLEWNMKIKKNQKKKKKRKTNKRTNKQEMIDKLKT